ncbi:MAG: hypothetical protein M3450_05135 [Actinomycetota bacterium]|nr:hypothetical protein [Actinomycetota bacterium]MDQ3640856.1 hypothetical protein [Actinomycetota bacterium]
MAHSANGALYTVDPATGASALIAGVSVPNADGIPFEAGRLWAWQNFSNQVSRSFGFAYAGARLYIGSVWSLAALPD